MKKYRSTDNLLWFKTTRHAHCNNCGSEGEYELKYLTFGLTLINKTICNNCKLKWEKGRIAL